MLLSQSNQIQRWNSYLFQGHEFREPVRFSGKCHNWNFQGKYTEIIAEQNVKNPFWEIIRLSMPIFRLNMLLHYCYRKSKNIHLFEEISICRKLACMPSSMWQFGYWAMLRLRICGRRKMLAFVTVWVSRSLCFTGARNIAHLRVICPEIHCAIIHPISYSRRITSSKIARVSEA